jgi:hypothetical protein
MSASVIQTIVAVWETPYTSEVWDVLQEKKTNARTQGDIDMLSFGPALPDNEDARVAMLTVHIHRGDETVQEKRALHWTLSARQPPKSDPPEQLREDDKKLGGRSGLMKLLESCMAGVPPIASYQLVMKLPGSEYQCKILPKEVSANEGHDIAVSLARTSRLEQMGYRFENSPYGLEEVALIYDHEDELVILNVRAEGVLRPGSKTWLPYADEVSDVLIKAFFLQGGYK